MLPELATTGRKVFEVIPHDRLTPLLRNVYLHRLDRDWQTRGRACSSATPTTWS
jgi:hypothetical protein